MPEVQAMSKGMVSATISIYNTILDELRPTPAKCHYTYNLRDVAKVFQGCLMMSKSKVMTGEDISRICL